MEIELTPEQDDLIRLGIEQGRYRDSTDAVSRAIDIWVEQERSRLELIAAIEEGERSLDAGEYIDLDSDEAIAEMMEDVKRRGRAKFAASDAA
jgi:Arc/MetJ-type ribon-helix-helix transcriptional regulator